jgi:hypothetical protein
MSALTLSHSSTRKLGSGAYYRQRLPEKRDNGEQETKSVLALGGADEYLGSQVIVSAKAHPSDPDVPEALYLTLRMIRDGCSRNWEWQDPNKPQSDPTAAAAYEIGAIMRRLHNKSLDEEGRSRRGDRQEGG